MAAQTSAATLPTYSPEEEERIIRNSRGVPVGVKPDRRWTPKRIVIWGLITALGVLGWTMLAIIRGEQVNTIWFVITAVCTYAIAYRFYALYVQRKIMRPDDTNATPAERINNGKDFDPTNRVVLYGHHFAAIAGAGPLVGPVLAAQMGYLPGTLWIVIGVCLAGAIQDMLVLFFSMRRGGRSLGQMATDEIGVLGGIVATVIVFVMLMIVLAVLAMVCVNALAESPWGVFSVGCTIPIAIGMGLWLRFVQPGKITQVSLVGFALLIGVIISGRWVAESGFGQAHLHLSPTTLVWAMVIYGFFAAVLPVWMLLTPRDYLSTFMKVGTIVVLALGIILVRPIVEMPAVTEFATNTAGPVFAGAIFPFLFITIACGALSGMHAMVSSGTSPKMIQKESQARMIGYGGMLMESFVAVMAMAAAVSLNQGIYFGMNTSTASVDKLAGSAVVQSADNREDITAEAIENLGVTDVNGNQIRAAWDSWDENGNPITVYDGDAYRAVAEDVGETSIVSRTGGAPTLAVGMAHILHQVGGGRTMMGFWYHFAIMFEALFILSAVDAVTRVARFQLSDALGNLIPRFADPSWRVGAWISTGVVVAAWGSLLLMGVTDPRGGIQTLYPLFGIANQLIAAVALLVVTVMVVRKGYARWVWIPIIPLVFDTVVTFTASWHKIFSHDPALGYWQQWRDARAELTTLTDPDEIAVTQAIVRNTFIQGTLSIVFVVTVAFVMVCGIIRIVRTLRTGDTTTSEDPRQESNFFAPTTMIGTALDKKCVAEYEIVGDPALIPGLKQADRASRQQPAGVGSEAGS
ncbi:carbon starvation CstA family protein [Propionibacterium australiense]|uniref:5TM C-terminal transporter carbon starvation CstA n=1 Tax=Propionibacterium australiense TaxID=119981 RepID=A0A383S9F4_9ACTN|nr:carbon starvation CstA family protein [Propionibacterium australiense]RLP11071.1 carbon starvation protein A [Propionibacterium australiense]RLP12395.1 carbon starvation protein A [Propionibacterium australiense]SYZ33999.1 5TM C-terminal transporter carbon starvation CstA [Propionibacterium australiense]VEH91326.1 Carbon starvation protein A [Propionibacterium australiense]